MSTSNGEAAWTNFLLKFFSSPNELSAAGDETVAQFVAQAERAWLANQPAPMFLPVLARGWTYWYACCPDREQQVWVRDLIRAYVGSWTDFDGRPVARDSVAGMDPVVHEFIGPEGCAFRFVVPRDARLEDAVRQSLARLSRTLAERPHRRIQLTRPLGRLIGDFWDACATGAEGEAAQLLDLLEQDQRLSKTNRLFLRLQFLAVFEHWDRLQQLAELQDLIRLDRPVLVSDALARFAMAHMPEDGSLADFREATAGFGGLVPSVTSIRSSAGAQYYAFWSLSAGEEAGEVQKRLLDSGWLEYAQTRVALASMLTVEDTTAERPVAVSGVGDDLRRAIEEGRLDSAIDLLLEVKPTVELIAVLADTVRRTLNPQAAGLLHRWLSEIDDPTVEGRIAAATADIDDEVSLAIRDFGETIVNVFSNDVAPGKRARVLDLLKEHAVPRLMQPGTLVVAVERIRLLTNSIGPESLAGLIDLLLDIERDLFAAAGDVPQIQELRLLTIEAWALGDDSGDRHRAWRLLDLVGRVLGSGVSAAVFDELVESLGAAWGQFLTDVDLPLGLEAIELLAASRPDGATAVDAFAVRILSRIGDHNVRRVQVDCLDAATALAAEFGLELGISHESQQDVAAGASERIVPPSGTHVVIYSLMEPAAQRAATILRRRFPGVLIETFADKVANDALRSAGRTADVLVIADRAAAHAATDALRAARGHQDIAYARGKGTTSLLEAARMGLDKLLNGIHAEAR